MLSALLTLFVFGIAGMILLSVLLTIVGVFFSLAFGLVGLLLFKVVPILLVGWVVLKLINHARKPERISEADQRWLDGE